MLLLRSLLVHNCAGKLNITKTTHKFTSTIKFPNFRAPNRKTSTHAGETKSNLYSRRRAIIKRLIHSVRLFFVRCCSSGRIGTPTNEIMPGRRPPRTTRKIVRFILIWGLSRASRTRTSTAFRFTISGASHLIDDNHTESQKERTLAREIMAKCVRKQNARKFDGGLRSAFQMWAVQVSATTQQFPAHSGSFWTTVQDWNLNLFLESLFHMIAEPTTSG